MGRQRNDTQLNQIRQLIQQHPNQKPAWFARQAGCDNKAIQRLIVQLEDRGDSAAGRRAGSTQLVWSVQVGHLSDFAG